MATSPTQPARIGRAQAALALTPGLGLAYLIGATGLAPAGQRFDPTWLGRFDFWPSLALAGGTLYGCAWLYGGWAGTAIARHPQRAGRVGAACGVLSLATAALVGAGWNFGQEALRYAPFPGTTGADYRQYLGGLAVDYVGKPLAYALPLGSLVAALLGAWAGRRTKAIIGNQARP